MTAAQEEWADSGHPPTLLPFAREAIALGICVLPARHVLRCPGVGDKTMRLWKPYQSRLPTMAELERWFTPAQDGIGLVTGKIGGNIEALDCDRHETFDALCAILRGIGQADLLTRLLAGYQDRSPRGAHILWRCEQITGNLSLAKRYDLDEHGKIKRSPNGKALTKGLIETRGEGGFLVIPPSHGRTHPSGKPYVQVSGGLASIATITPEERTIILDVARSLTEVREEEEKPRQQQHTASDGTRPGDLFNARATWEEILEPHGWRKLFDHAEKGYWRRPGKDRGISATTNYADSGLLYIFSTSTDFEANRGYSKFSAYALLNHNSDFAAAAEELLRRGYSQNGAGGSNGTADEKQEESGEKGAKRAEAPRPLMREHEASAPYPVEHLLSLAPVVERLHAVIGAPLAICGHSVLAAAALAVQGHANLILDGRVSPLSLFFLTVAESGERKSEVDRQALWVHWEHEKRLKEDRDARWPAYEDDLMAYQRAREQAATKAKTREEKRTALAAIGPPPDMPLDPTLTMQEPTYEGLVKHFQYGQPSLGLFSDEGGRFIGGYSMSDDHQLKTAAGFSELWDGKRISRVRGGEGSTPLQSRSESGARL